MPAGTGFALQNRGSVFTLSRGSRTRWRGTSVRCTRSFPAFMQKDGVTIGFGIMGGFNQAQAHAQFVANVVDFGMNIQAAMDAARFNKGNSGCGVRYGKRLSALDV